MTYFLNQNADTSQLKPRGRDVQPTGFMDGLGAAFSKASLENDANFRLAKEKEGYSRTLAEKAWERLGDESARAGLKQRNVYVAGDDGPAAIKSNLRSIPAVVELAREAAAANPEQWADLDLSDEGRDLAINTKLQAEHADTEAILNMMPSLRGAADFMGGMAGITADIKNVPFMLGGGGGSLLRVAGREAMINMGAEAAFLPAQFEMSERLGIEDPDVVSQLAMAAGAGAIFGGAIEAGSRAFTYMRGRNRMPPTADPVFDAAAMDAAEDALVAGENPFEAADRVRADAPEPAPLPPARDPAKMEPLILDPSQRVQDAPQPTAAPTAPDDAILPPQQAQDAAISPLDVLLDPRVAEAQSINDMADASVRDVMANDSGAAKPLVTWMRNSHRVTKKAMRDAEKAGRPMPAGGENMQVDPQGAAGRELRAMGVTPKTNPGLFSKNGRGDFDNLVAAEMEDSFPGITAAAGMSDDGIYLDRQGFLDVIARDANGDQSWLQSRADVAVIEADRDMALRAVEDGDFRPTDDFLDGVRANDGFFVDVNAYEFDDVMGDAAERIAADFDEYFQRRWADAQTLTADERAEIINELQTRGGDAEYLVQRVIERDLDYGDLPVTKADDYGTYDPEDYLRYLDQSEAGRVFDESELDIGRQEEIPDPARGGAEGEGFDRGPYAEERTAAGTQALIDGVAPITQRDRLQARQAAPMGGGRQRAPDSQIGGLFDPDDKVRADMFSEPTGPKARPTQDAMMADVRDQVAKSDFDVDMGDSLGPRKASSVMDEFDMDDEFQAILDACGKPGGKA
jgi:hypothetical protein